MTKQFSKYNLMGKLADSDNYFLINPLSGNADILSPEKAREIDESRFTDVEEYEEKGYLVDPREEAQAYQRAYLDFTDRREESEIQIFFVPHYSCNFNCSYCYQDQYENIKGSDAKKTIDAFYEYIETEFAGKQKYLTLFGGEPLLPSPGVKEQVSYFLKKSKEKNLDVAVVTNGYHLSEYLDILKEASIREIQVTLDGTEKIHDARRRLNDGSGTFHTIVSGINNALAGGFPVNLRVVVDKENIKGLVDLARFAKTEGWTGNPLFKTQIGRNYELHHCQAKAASLFDRAGLYEKLYQSIQEYPEIMEFHRPAFSISRFLFDNGELPDPLFDSCPGCKTEWAFDYTGSIYSCTATVGKKDEELGTFYPEITQREDTIEKWEDRDVTSIPECRDCASQLLCGGGCAAVAKNSNGKILSPDCRPVKDLLSLGISYYFEKEKHNE